MGRSDRLTGESWGLPSWAFLALAGVVIAGSVAVRLALLGRQSYWIDELFSVSGSSGSLRTMVRLGSSEVHPPFYAAVLWGWMKIGGTGEAWTRSLSTLCAVTSVLVAHRGLRGLGLSDHVRWALTVATAAGGASVVYSLETRSYALLLLGAVGLTATTLRAALSSLDRLNLDRLNLDRPSLDRPDLSAGIFVTWTGWSCLAATAHLFGAVLTLAAFALLAAVTLAGAPSGRARRPLTWAVLAAAGCSGQAAWFLLGGTRPGFASGTGWIQAPDGEDVWDLATTTFSSGGLTAHPDGFAWTSPAGVLIVAAVCLWSAVLGHRARRVRGARRRGTAVRDGWREAGEGAVPRTAEGPAAAILLVLAVLVIVPAFGVSQRTHLWTLRNLVTVTPALSWGVICLAAAATGTAAGRARVATVTVALLGIGLVPTAVGVAAPYKTDFRGLFGYLADVRESHPDADFFFIGPGPPLGWRPVSDPHRVVGQQVVGQQDDLGSDLDPQPLDARDAVPRTPGPEVVVLYRGVADRRPDPAVALLIDRLGPSTCRRIPIHGLGVVRCD